MARKRFIVIQSGATRLGPICEAEWKRVLSRVDFLLARYHPDLFATFGEVGKPMKDTICPRQAEPVRAEDMV